MFIVWIYVGVCLLWGSIAGYKQSRYSIKSTFGTYLAIISMNMLLFPYAFYIAIKENKL